MDEVAQGSASMYFSSSLSFLTNSCASLLVRPSSILSADLTAGMWADELVCVGHTSLP